VINYQGIGNLVGSIARPRGPIIRSLRAILIVVAFAMPHGSAAAATSYAGDAVVSTVAGSPGQSGTADGTGSAARFNRPSGLWIDRSGVLYIADAANHTIRTMSPGGVVRTLAGTPGVFGYADGPSGQALFTFPHGVAVDGGGNAYVPDGFNHAIRKISAAGVVSTLAGGVGIPGFVDGPGPQARFHQPEGVATDSAGNVYVADAGNSAIRMISPGGIVSTLATDIGSPLSIAIDNSGNRYVAAGGDCTVRKITPAGVVSLLAGSWGQCGSDDGQGSAARFNTPFGVAVDAAGNVYVTDFFNDTIRQIAPNSMVNTIAGAVQTPGAADGPGRDARFNHPWGIATDAAGNLFVSEDINNTVRKIATAVPTMVPTLSEWSRIALASLLGVAGAIALRRHRAGNRQWQCSPPAGRLA
jgi:sugar lactone lactonase YvrE